jgi:hypothetical protein
MATNNTEDTPPDSGNNFVYNTPVGFVHIWTILQTCQSFELHNWQIERICSILDNLDLMVTTATRTGKTGLFIMLILMICAISCELSLALGPKRFPKDPAMIVVCLTKAFE